MFHNDHQSPKRKWFGLIWLFIWENTCHIQSVKSNQSKITENLCDSFLPLHVFKCFLTLCGQADKKEQCLHVINFSPLCISMRILMLDSHVALVTFVGFCSAMGFHVRPHVPWIGGIFRLLAFVEVMPTVCFHVLFQVAWLNWGIFTLVTFVELLSTVCHHMPFQIT